MQLSQQSTAVMQLARKRSVARGLCILAYTEDGAESVFYMSDPQSRDSLLYRLALSGQATAIALREPQ